MHVPSPSRKHVRSWPGVWLAIAASLSILSGCPRRFDSKADPIPSSTDPAIEREYREARARMEAGDPAEAAAKYATFIAQHPDDPLARSAKVGEARARLALGEADKAKLLLEPVAKLEAGAEAGNDPTATRARFLLAEALVRTGEYARGRTLLQPFRGVPATSDDEVLLHALLASAALGLEDSAEALVELEHFYEGARPPERRYVLAQAGPAAAKLGLADAERLWQGDRRALLTAFVGARLAELKRATDPQGAAKIDEDVLGAREKLGLGERRHATARTRTLKAAVGCVLPLSGKARALGERALRGALLGAELLGAAGGQGALTIEIRDSGSDAARARAAMEDLAASGVLAVVGAPDRAGALEVAMAAGALGLPTFALGPDDGRGSPTLFRLARPRAEAAAAAARLFAEQRLSRVAVLAPDGLSGKELARVFVEAARARGLTVVADVRYGESATTFVKEVSQVQAQKPQGLFLAATAAQLDLLAPQLATAGLAAMTNLKASGREVKIIAMADGLSPRSLTRSGKYLQGAILMPPFWADSSDPRAQAFLERYREAYGEEPSLLDALAFDAVRAVRLVLSQRGEPGSWAEVAQGLRELDAGGLTGSLGFGTDGARSGEIAAWIVDGATLRPRGK